jgi:hypothetical protein
MRPLAAWLDELDALWPGPEFELPEEIEAQVALGANGTDLSPTV